MKSQVLALFLLFVVINGYSQELKSFSKKPFIILYEDGTWQKGNDEPATQVIPDIENTWKLFQEAIKTNDSNKVAEFFDYPFEIDVSAMDEVREYKSLTGNFSKNKLLDNFSKLFNKRFTDLILKGNADEYGKMAGYNAYYFDLAKSQEIELVYEIQFYLVKNQYKIGMILIGYAK